MKKEKNQVAKLEKKAKDDNRDANGNTNELKLNNTIKNENEETSKKKKGRPKKSSNDLFETIYPKLSLKLSDEEIEKLKGKDRIIAKIVSKSENPKELKKKLKKYKKQIEELGQPKELLNSEELLTKAVYEAESKNLTKAQLLQQKIDEAGLGISENSVENDKFCIKHSEFNSSIYGENPIRDLTQNEHQQIAIRLKNLTDEKLKNVTLFDYLGHWVGQVEHSPLATNFPFNEFLRKMSSISSENWRIKYIRCHAECEYQKFAEKQSDSGIRLTYSNIMGHVYSEPYKPEHKKDWDARGQKQIADIEILPNKSLNSDLQIELDYLMPDTEVIITINIER